MVDQPGAGGVTAHVQLLGEMCCNLSKMAEILPLRTQLACRLAAVEEGWYGVQAQKPDSWRCGWQVSCDLCAALPVEQALPRLARTCLNMSKLIRHTCMLYSASHRHSDSEAVAHAATMLQNPAFQLALACVLTPQTDSCWSQRPWRPHLSVVALALVCEPGTRITHKSQWHASRLQLTHHTPSQPSSAGCRGDGAEPGGGCLSCRPGADDLVAAAKSG